jgi:hypothetical protein
MSSQLMDDWICELKLENRYKYHSIAIDDQGNVMVLPSGVGAIMIREPCTRIGTGVLVDPSLGTRVWPSMNWW